MKLVPYHSFQAAAKNIVVFVLLCVDTMQLLQFTQHFYLQSPDYSMYFYTSVTKFKICIDSTT